MKRTLYIAAAAACAAGFAWTLYLVFYTTPMPHTHPWEGVSLYFNQKIFYYHVPNGFVLFTSVFVCGIASILYLRSRKPRWDDVAVAGAQLAVLFGGCLLVTGSIWAKPAWGRWWEWDARLTSSLLLWMTMVGYALVRRYGGPGSERLASGLAIFAMVNVPLVYLSTRLWRTNHPQTSTVPSLSPEMRGAFWLCVLVFIIFFVLMLRFRIDAIRTRRRVDEARDRALDAGLLE